MVCNVCKKGLHREMVVKIFKKFGFKTFNSHDLRDNGISFSGKTLYAMEMDYSLSLVKKEVIKNTNYKLINLKRYKLGFSGVKYLLYEGYITINDAHSNGYFFDYRFENLIKQRSNKKNERNNFN